MEQLSIEIIRTAARLGGNRRILAEEKIPVMTIHRLGSMPKPSMNPT